MIRFEPLTDQHDTRTFRSGGAFLDHYLQNQALKKEEEDLAHTVIAIDAEWNRSRCHTI